MKKFLLLGLFASLMSVGLAPVVVGGSTAVAQTRLPDFADLAEKAGPAVVNIRTTERVRENAGPAPR
ncbi:MAG: serine peptidase, partial [Betaproteobacteria bacterium]